MAIGYYYNKEEDVILFQKKDIEKEFIKDIFYNNNKSMIPE
jgi:hypothetical protein